MSASIDVDTRPLRDPDRVPIYALSGDAADAPANEHVLVEYAIAKLCVAVAEQKCIALIDSCSAVNLLSANFLNSLPPEYQSKFQARSSVAEHTTLVAFDGSSSVRPIGHILLPVDPAENNPREVLFLVSDRAAHPVLLGTPAIRSLQLIIDMEGNRVQSKLTGASFHLVQQRTIQKVPSTSYCNLPVAITDTFILPPWSEALVEGIVNFRDRSNGPSNVNVILHDRPPTNNSRIRVAYGHNSVSDGITNVLISNMSPTRVHIPRGSPIASATFAHPPPKTPGNNTGARPAKLQHISDEQWKQHTDEIIASMSPDDAITPEQREDLTNLITRYADTFTSSIVPLGVTDTVKHKIELTGNPNPHREPLRVMGPMKTTVSREKLQQLLNSGTVEPSRSPWAAAVVITPKKASGQWRFAIDYRRLNDVTKFDAYPMARADRGLELLNGCTFFTTIDLASGFHQVQMEETSKELTAFLTQEGLFQFTRMPFGLKCAPATFQRLMDIVLAGLTWRQCLVYLDDILIFTMGPFSNHLTAIGETLQRLRAHGLRAQPGKCTFARRSLTYLGHVINSDGIRPDKRLVEAVASFPQPTNVPQVRSFLGLSGYYRLYIDHFAEVAAPLTKLLQKDQPFHWGPDQAQSFATLRNHLSSAPLLRYPDFSKTFFVKTDFSHLAIGAVLTQFDDTGNEYPVAYLSRRCQGKESTYSARRGEAVALWYSVKRWRPFLEGVHFKVVSDHLSLAFLRRPQDDAKLQRVVNELEHFSFDVVYKKGSRHVDADALSRCYADPCCRENADIVDDDEHLFDAILSLTSGCDAPNLVEINMEQLLQAQNQDTTLRSIPGAELDANGLLRRKCPTTNRLQTIVPRCFRQLYMNLAHSSRPGGHFGQKRTCELLSKFGYWPGMTSDVRSFVNQCLKCQTSKIRKPNRAGKMVRRTPEFLPAWSKIHIDHFGPLNRSRRGNFQYILTVVCLSSRSVRFLPVKDKSANTAADALIDLFTQESFPIHMTSDRAQSFRSHLFEALSKAIGMKLVTTVSHRPQGNSIAERPHAFLRASLTALCNKDQTDWPELAGLISLTYRSCVHPALSETPFFLERGRDPRVPQELLVPADITSQIPDDVQQWRDKMITRLSKARKLALVEDAKMIARNASRYDKNRTNTDLRLGELVLVYRSPSSSSNLDSTRRTRTLESYASGPWRIIANLTNNNFQLQHIRSGQTDAFNADTIVPLRTPPNASELELETDEIQEEELEFTNPYGSENDADDTDDENDTDDESLDEDQEPRQEISPRISAARPSMPPNKWGYSAASQFASQRSLRPVPDRLSRAAAASVAADADLNHSSLP